VRRRVKLLEFDKDKFKKSVERGGTLLDYMELDKINDVDLRNSVLDKIGTPNFKYELQAAIDKEKREKTKALWVAELVKFAKQVKNSDGLQYVNSYYNLSQEPDITAPNDAETVEYFFLVSDYGGGITLYKKSENNRNSASDNSVNEEKQKMFREKRSALEEITKRAYQLRHDFVFDISNTKAKKSIGFIIEFTLRSILGDYSYIDYEDFARALNIEIGEDDEAEYNYDTIAEHVVSQPERHLLVAAYLALDSASENYYDYNNQYRDNKTLNTVYDFLEKLGYETSEEERSLRNGTHKLFENSGAAK
jgi:ParB family chromosome partitioning protein